MKALLTIFHNLDELENAIQSLENESFTFYAEDWEEGVIFKENIKGKDVLANFQKLRGKYGETFIMHAFNGEKEISWRYDEGAFAEIKADGELDVEEEEFILEGDTHRFPGIKSFQGFKKVKIQKISSKGKTLFYKLGGLEK